MMRSAAREGFQSGMILGKKKKKFQSSWRRRRGRLAAIALARDREVTKDWEVLRVEEKGELGEGKRCWRNCWKSAKRR